MLLSANERAVGPRRCAGSCRRDIRVVQLRGAGFLRQRAEWPRRRACWWSKRRESHFADVLEFGGDLARRYPQARLAIMADHELRPWQWTLHEAPAAYVAVSPRELTDFGRLAANHFARVPRARASFAASVWAELPWAGAALPRNKELCPMAAAKVDEFAVRTALQDFPDPETGGSVVELGQLSAVRVDGDSVFLTLALSSHSAILRDRTARSSPSVCAAGCPACRTWLSNWRCSSGRRRRSARSVWRPRV